MTAWMRCLFHVGYMVERLLRQDGWWSGCASGAVTRSTSRACCASRLSSGRTSILVGEVRGRSSAGWPAVIIASVLQQIGAPLV